MKNNSNTSTPTSENKLNHLNDKMNVFRARYPTSNSNMWLNQFSVSSYEFGNLQDCKFYVSDKNTKRGIAFSVAYNSAKQSENNTELCAYVASMICDVSPGFRTSVEAALKGISARPVETSLVEANVSKIFDWPTILVYFGCCILLLFKETTEDEVNYNTLMSSCVHELREITGCDPDTKLDTPPFDFKKAKAVTTMLGASSYLRADTVKFILSNSDNMSIYDTAIPGVCLYLCNKLSWSRMRHFSLVNDFLVKPQSSFLLDPRVSKEVDNLMEACDVIASHTHPQFYMYLASQTELLKVEPSRFPTLIAVAEILEKRSSLMQV